VTLTDKHIRRSYIELHIAVLFWGFSAILAALIEMSWFMITLWRVFLASMGLFLLLYILKIPFKIRRKDVFKFSGIAVLIALHWLTFFGSVKFANASIALITFASFSFIISFLEPIINRTSFSLLDTMFGLVIIPAMYMIVQSIDASMHFGFAIGIVSALLAALFGVLNKKLISQADPLVITSIEMIAATIFLSVLLPVWYYINPDDKLVPAGTDWIYLAVLALGCTCLAFYILVRALRYITVFAQSMVMNLEPVYGIIFAIIILNDNKDLNASFYIGVFIILITVFLHPIIKRKFSEVPH